MKIVKYAIFGFCLLVLYFFVRNDGMEAFRSGDQEAKKSVIAQSVHEAKNTVEEQVDGAAGYWDENKDELKNQLDTMLDDVSAYRKDNHKKTVNQLDAFWENRYQSSDNTD